MKANKIIKVIEDKAPLSLMMEFDSSGLNVGNKTQDIKKILLCENVTMDVLDEAIQNDAQMIISHHPSIFNEGNDKFTKDIVKKAKDNKLVLYSAHTNLDAAKDGINDRLCKLLDIEVSSKSLSCYRIGKLNKPLTLEELSNKVKKVLKDNKIKVVGDKNKIINTVCVSSGAGARDDELIECLSKDKVDAIIGGESKISIALKIKYYNMSLIDVSHYLSEIICVDIFKEWLQDLDIDMIISNKDVNPYWD